MTAASLIVGAVMAVPVLLLIGFALGPVALVPLLIAACVAPLLLIVGAIWLFVGKR